MKVVALTGLKGSGKDTAAQVLIQDGWTRLAFADPLREMLYALNPIIKSGSPPGSKAFGPMDEYGKVTRWREYLDYHGYEALKKIPEARRLMQVFGTEVMRQQYGQDVWVDLAERLITTPAFPDTKWVLTDCRFDNEAEMVRRHGGAVIRVERTECSGDGHASEAGVSEHLVDWVVQNNGSIEDLHDRIRWVSGSWLDTKDFPTRSARSLSLVMDTDAGGVDGRTSVSTPTTSGTAEASSTT